MIRQNMALSLSKTGTGRGSGLRAALLVALISWGLGGSAASAAVLTDLGTLPGDVKSIAYGINYYGDVVGISYSSTGSTRAFLWHPFIPNGTAGTLIDLSGYLSTYNSGAFAINDTGYIVGYFDAAVPIPGGGPDESPGGFTGPGGFTYYMHAFLLRPNLTRCDLNGSSSTSTGVAYGINNVVTASESVGKVVGDKDGTAVLWPDPNCDGPTVVVMIPPPLFPPVPGGAIASSARGINDDDVAVGWTHWPTDNTTPQSAFKWSAATGSYTLLSPNQHSSCIHFSEALGISSQGNHIVGWIEKANVSAIRAESWNGTTSGSKIFSDLVLSSTYWGGAINGEANAVNNSDRIVGYCNTDPGTSPGGWHAFVSVGSSITDLNTFLTIAWQSLVEAKGINDFTNHGMVGQIVGYGTTAAGATHAFLFTP